MEQYVMETGQGRVLHADVPSKKIKTAGPPRGRHPIASRAHRSSHPWPGPDEAPSPPATLLVGNRDMVATVPGHLYDC